MNEAAKREDDYGYYTDLPVGEILRRTRLHYGQSLVDVENVLRIRATQLDAIENGQPERLPGRVYAIGFVRSYSEYLGLDGDKMVALFKAQTLGNKDRPELHFPAPASESKVPNLWVVLSSLAGIIVIGIIWATIGSTAPDKEINQVPPVPEHLQARTPDMAELAYSPGIAHDPVALPQNQPVPEDVQPPAVQEAAAEPAAVEAATPSPAPEVVVPEHRVTIEVSERSWVEIRDNSGKIILSRTLEPGNTYFVPPDREGLILTTGNAGGLLLKVDGNLLPTFGKRGDVRRNIPLDAEALKKFLD